MKPVQNLANIQAENDALRAENLQLRHELDQLKRLIFGQKRERFVSEQNPEQLHLALETEAPVEPKVDEQQKITYTRQKRKNENHPGRNPLPDHLPRERVVLEPEVDTEGMICIGEEVTETLEYTAGRLFVRQEVRPKYAEKITQTDTEEKTRVHMASRTWRPIDKGIAGASLLTHILVSKYLDHQPLYRQAKIFRREGVQIADSSLADWVAAVCTLLEPLYERLKEILLSEDYLMADETHIPVLDSQKAGASKGKGKTHRGYHWVYMAPLLKLILFDYQKGRGKAGPKGLLVNYKGYLQTDGYRVYSSLFDKRKDILLLGCMAHARRKFDQAKDSDPQNAKYALSRIQQLYQIERKARRENMGPRERKQLRDQKALPVLAQLQAWMIDQYPKHLPKSPMANAIGYALQRWEKLSRYTQDGRLEIDNNWVENAIRPVALGRKNYLFAGSHKAAYNAAIIYSLLGSCEKCGINPKHWMNEVLNRIPGHPINQIDQLLPHLWNETGKQNP